MATYTGIKSILQEFLRRALPSGMIVSYGGSSVPQGWLLCNGEAVSRTTYKNLFSAIGTLYGGGDGSSTFNLPDLRESVPVGAGTRVSGVSMHDTYSVGMFKDDQFMRHTHSFSGTTGGMSANSAGHTGLADRNANGTNRCSGPFSYKLRSDEPRQFAPSNQKDNYSLYMDISHTHSFGGITASSGGGSLHTANNLA